VFELPSKGLYKVKNDSNYCTINTMKKHYTPEELSPTPITLNLRSHIVRDLKIMEKNTKQTVDDLVTKALLMFIATHNDFLGRNKVG